MRAARQLRKNDIVAVFVRTVSNKEIHEGNVRLIRPLADFNKTDRGHLAWEVMFENGDIDHRWLHPENRIDGDQDGEKYFHPTTPGNRYE